MKLEDSADVDCEDTCTGLYVFDDANWQTIKTKTVEKIRVGHSEHYDDIDKDVKAALIQKMVELID